MTGPDDQLRALARAHGVYLDFFDLHGVQHVASPDTLRALLRGLGVPAGTAAEVAEALDALRGTSATLPAEHVVRAGLATPLPSPACSWTVLDEAGQIVGEGVADTSIPLPALPVGYFHLDTRGDGWSATTFVLSRPARAPDLVSRCQRETCWGATGALYGLRSRQNGGLGNYSDLGRAAAMLGHKGAQFLGVNPLHAIGWTEDDIISPYSPSHRGAFNTDHITVPGGLGPCPDDPFVDYTAFRAAQRTRLQQVYADPEADRSGFETWAATCPEDLKRFAVFEAISERHGPDFRTWPRALQQPGPKADEAAGTRADFHLWLQWLAETQIHAAQAQAQAAGMALGLYLDLAVGPRPDGAEVWMNGATIAEGVTIGAPPDHLSPEGQSWALAAHAPRRLAAADYAPLRSMLRTLMATCGLLRIDHALGLLRSFWIPEDGSPGGYITQPLDRLLAVITIEAHRAGCVVVGEDLGLVPDGFRDAMNDAGLYSYAVWQFEATHQGDLKPPDRLPAYSLACFGTHDTPTLRGFWYGNDIEWWHKVGWISGPERVQRHAHRARQRASLRSVTGLAPDASGHTITDTLHAGLAASPAALVSVQLDDVFGELDAQNLPGTVDAHPNWQRRLAVPLEQMSDHPALDRASDVMNTHRTTQDDMACPKEVPA